MFKFIILAFLWTFTKSFVPSLPPDQLIFKPSEPKPNSPVIVKNLGHDTIKLEWSLKKESKNPYAPIAYLQFSDFSMNVQFWKKMVGSDDFYCNYFFFEMNTQDDRLKYYEYICNWKMGDGEDYFDRGGKMTKSSNESIGLNCGPGGARDLFVSCKLQISFP